MRSAPPHHATVRTYVAVAVILTLITALEFGVIYIRRLAPVVVPLLLVMSAATMVIGHQREEQRIRVLAVGVAERGELVRVGHSGHLVRRELHSHPGHRHLGAILAREPPVGELTIHHPDLV